MLWLNQLVRGGLSCCWMLWWLDDEGWRNYTYMARHNYRASWFLSYSPWISRQKLIKFNRNVCCFKQQQILKYWLSLCWKCPVASFEPTIGGSIISQFLLYYYLSEALESLLCDVWYAKKRQYWIGGDITLSSEKILQTVTVTVMVNNCTKISIFDMSSVEPKKSAFCN